MLTASQSQKTRTLSEQEIEQLFVDHYDLLYAAAKSVTDNKHDAEDIVQTLFLKFVGQKFLAGDHDQLQRVFVSSCSQ